MRKARVWLRSETFQERCRQARLADARLHRTATPLDLRHSLPSTSAAAAIRVLLPARQGRSVPLAWSASNRPSAELARSAAQARTGPAMPLRSFVSEVLKLEQIAEELARAFGNDNAVRLGNPLQARRKVRRFAHDGLLLRRARSDQIADYH